MGSAQSAEPRSVSLQNPHPSSILNISNDVVNRLKKNAREEKAKAESKPEPKPSPKPTKKTTPPAAPMPPAPTIIYQHPGPVAVASGATVTASDVRREMEAELRKNDNLWRERMFKLEETLKKTNTIMEEEYSTAVENVRSRFAKAPPSHQLPPCQDLKAQLVACCKAHPGETLLCSEVAAQFRNCVSAHCIKKLEKHEEEKPASAPAPAATTKAKAG